MTNGGVLAAFSVVFKSFSSKGGVEVACGVDLESVITNDGVS